MKKHASAVLVAGALLLAACNSGDTKGANTQSAGANAAAPSNAAASAAAAPSASTNSAATNTAAAEGGDFELVNNSTFQIQKFETFEEGAWSDNWLNTNVAPGETYDMTWAEDGTCTVRARVTYADRDSAEGEIDFCKARRIEVTNDGISWG